MSGLLCPKGPLQWIWGDRVQVVGMTSQSDLEGDAGATRRSLAQAEPRTPLAAASLRWLSGTHVTGGRAELFEGVVRHPAEPSAELIQIEGVFSGEVAQRKLLRGTLCAQAASIQTRAAAPPSPV
jgi:hypothetical protein